MENFFKVHARRKCGKGSFGDHVNWECIFIDYMDRECDSLTMRFGQDLMEVSPF
jgi:hypothetical protein